MTPAEEVRLAVEALNTMFGMGGQAKLARALTKPEGGHVNPRTVRRWLAGKTTPSETVLERIRAIRAEKARKATSQCGDNENG